MEEQGDPYFEKIEIAARHLAGTTQEVSQQQTQPSDPNAEQLWQQRQWLHQQILEHQGALNAGMYISVDPSFTASSVRH